MAPDLGTGVRLVVISGLRSLTEGEIRDADRYPRERHSRQREQHAHTMRGPQEWAEHSREPSMLPGNRPAAGVPRVLALTPRNGTLMGSAVDTSLGGPGRVAGKQGREETKPSVRWPSLVAGTGLRVC